MHFSIGEITSADQKISFKPVIDFAPARYAVEEINAYVAARDSLLQEAEQNPTEATIKRARLANDFLANCLKPSRPPYHAQYLAEADARRELQRCRDLATKLGALVPA